MSWGMVAQFNHAPVLGESTQIGAIANEAKGN
jgi:hypothetical protein